MNSIQKTAGSAVLLLSSSLAVADAAVDPSWPQGHMWEGWWGMGGIGMLLFWVLIVVAIVAIVRGIGGGSRSQESKALDILKAQFARGEIDEATYRQKKAVLEE